MFISDLQSPLSESPRPSREKRPSLKFIESIAETIPDVGRVKIEPKVKAEPKVKDSPSPVKIEPKVGLTGDLESHTPSSKENTPSELYFSLNQHSSIKSCLVKIVLELWPRKYS